MPEMIVVIADYQVEAGTDKIQSNRPADAARCSCDQSDRATVYITHEPSCLEAEHTFLSSARDAPAIGGTDAAHHETAST